MTSVIQLKQGKNPDNRRKKYFDLSSLYSDKDDDSTADEEDLVHTRIKRRGGRSPNNSQMGLNSDVRNLMLPCFEYLFFYISHYMKFVN